MTALCRSLANSLTPVADIQRLVADHYGLPLGIMLSRERAQPAPEARQVAMYIASTELGKNLSEVGRRFQRHHTTVAHGISRVTSRLDVLGRADAIRAGMGEIA